MVNAHLTAEEIALAEELGLSLVVIDPLNPLDDRVTSIGATNWVAGLAVGGRYRLRGGCDPGHRRCGNVTFSIRLRIGRVIG